jgi:hypothetical protein
MFDLIAQLSPELRDRLVDAAAAESAEVLDSLVEAAALQGPSEELSPLIERLPPAAQQRIAAAT